MFWIISAVLILIAFAFILPPMLRKHRSDADADNDAQRAQNILIANEQLAELEQQFEKGEIDQETYQNSRDELELTLFSDVKDSDTQAFSDGTDGNKIPLISIIAILLFIPALSILLYQKLGNPVYTTGFDSKAIAANLNKTAVPRKADGTPDIDRMVAGLEKKLQADPKNAKGWYMLGRSYMVLKRYPDAVRAYENAYKQMPDSVNIMLSLADSLAMKNGGNISGRPAELVNKALKIDPENLTALWLGGMAARQKKDYVTAIQRWTKVLGIIEDPAERKEVRSLIVEAESLLSPEQRERVKSALASIAPATEKTPAKTNQGATPGASVTVSVSLSDAFKDKVQPTDLVFIYAKAMSGPPMPLAAAKIQVKDLPAKVVLNDSMAMMPSMKLSGHAEVVVGARVSKSGRPIAQPGDLYAEKRGVKLGSAAQLEINTIKE